MMHKVLMFTALLIAISCQENEQGISNLTGNEVTYFLQPGADYPVSGTVTFKERKDGSTLVVIALEGTEGNAAHPVHLHLGDISTPDAAIAALLNPVAGSSGRSETVLSRLADETPVNFTDLLTLYACIKIHLSDAGPERDIILAGGNIGSAFNNPAGRRRAEFAICRSE
jgi:hypothetical protein